MFGFNVKDGVAYKVELPEGTDGSVITEAAESACDNVDSMAVSMNASKVSLSNLLVGIANEVTQAYARIHAKKDPYAPPAPMATAYDIYEMMDKYKDYYKAMAEYVKLICDIKGDEVDKDKASEKISKALSNDPGFIHSIVDTDKMDLERCMKQFECVVELIHDIDDRSNQINQIFSHAPQTELRNMAERLICGSVCKYHEEMVKFVRSNVDSLKSLLSGKVTAPVAPATPSNAYIML